MGFTMRLSLSTFLVLALAPCLALADDPSAPRPDPGIVPAGPDGRPLNLGFETGTLKDWTAEGEAFQGQPIKGDTVRPRRGDMSSRHAGDYWIGTYEVQGDEPQGTLTSAPFRLTKPFASFLVAGGSGPNTRVEIVRKADGKVLFATSGDDTEDLKRVAVDLTGEAGQEVFIRLVDAHKGGWGHINFDDFRLHDAKPSVPPRPGALVADVYAHAGLDPEAAARAMTVPEGFRVQLFAGEPDVVQPIAFCLDDRGRLWVAEAYSYPRRVPDNEAKDRILIFEDEDGDGRFDSRKVFIEKLNLVSGIEVGFGGVWVGAAPEFLFIPDQDGDDRPDGPPRVLLDGWGQQDTHETLNSFNWGPDGWLYGCHGVFTHSRVGKPGTPDAERTPINAGIWRYHPTKHRFEVFAHGTSNPWGVDFNDRGQAFLTSCVIPHLYHVIQGGRYERQAGQHFNPYTYDDIKTIADHRHYLGANPHGGNGRSDAAGGGHAHAGALIYLADTWPAEYRDSIFMNNIHGARLNRDILTPKGSGFVGSHGPDFLLANDSWSQILNFRCGPDGNVYMIDWYDKNQCHRNEVEVHDRTNGRIFKIVYGEPARRPFVVKGRDGEHRSLAELSNVELADLLAHPNEWYVRHARRLLQERAAKQPPDPQHREAIALMAFGHPQETYRLRLLWALHGYGGLDESHIVRGLVDESPYVRAWTIQLAMEDRAPSQATRATFAALAKSDPSPVVRLYLASALQRLPLEQRWEILEALAAHGEDSVDPNLPLMVWYAAEPLAASDPARAAKLAGTARIPLVQTFLARRVGSLGSAEAIESLVQQLKQTDQSPRRMALLAGINEALKGRRSVEMPASWPSVFESLMQDREAQVRSQSMALALTFGDARTQMILRRILLAADTPQARLDALAALLRVRDPELPKTLTALLTRPGGVSGPLRAAAIRGLAAYDDPAIPETILHIYPGLTAAEKRDALSTLAARKPGSRALLAAVEKEQVPRTDLTADLIRQLRSHKDPELDERIAQVWGQVRETSQDRAAAIAHYKADILKDADKPVDLHQGRAVFARTCAQCHTLFGVGAKVGPDLTGSNRADLDYLLSNILDPSALVGKDYQAHTIATIDGRVLVGLIQAEDRDALTIITANETLTIPKTEIDDRKLSEQSMMPEDLLKPLSWDETRALLAYLASPTQVALPLTAENAASFFNGRDLTGWVGDPGLWTVEDGQIVGRTEGLEHNEFLKSDLLAGDFRLTLQVKLVNNEGNSGIQFRSRALPEGTEVEGYQADIGPGWWGKLYEEHGRGLLWTKSGESAVKPGEWNSYEIVAQGSRIRTFINGQPCVDLDDPSGARRGIVAFQLHSGGPTEVRFKGLKLEPLGTSQTASD
jgi:putative membrane-bound dehydrogenase-like protein